MMHENKKFEDRYNLTADEIKNFKYAPLTSTDVERSFSLYKRILTDSWTSIHFDSMRMLIVCTQLV